MNKISNYIFMDKRWQKPVNTEENNFKFLVNENKNLYQNDILLYPWASFIDYNRQKNLICNKQYELEKEYLFKINIKNGITFCQHICYYDIIDLIKKMNINILFASHSKIKDKNTDIIILPMNILPTQVKDIQVDSKLKNIQTFFQGAYNPKIYGDIRRSIFNLSEKFNDSKIINTKQWYYEKLTYEQNIRKCNDNITNILDENYIKDCISSKYSLCPSGSGPNSIRFYESYYYKQNPILLSDNLLLENTYINGVNFIKFPELLIDILPDFLNNDKFSINLNYKFDKYNNLTISYLKILDNYDKIMKINNIINNKVSYLKEYKSYIICNLIKNNINTDFLYKPNNDLSSIITFLLSINNLILYNDNNIIKINEYINYIKIFFENTKFENIFSLIEFMLTFKYTLSELIYFRINNKGEKNITLTTSIFSENIEELDFYFLNILQQKKIENIYVNLYNISFSNSKFFNNLLNKICKIYDNFKLINLEKDPGLYEIWNNSYELSNTKYIGNINFGEYVTKDYYNILSEILDNIDIDLISSNSTSYNKLFYSFDIDNKNWINFDINNKHKFKFNNYEIFEYSFNDILSIKNNKYVKVNYPHSTPLFKKAIFKNIKFNENKFKAFADTAFWYEYLIKNQNRRFGFLNKIMLNTYFSENSKGQNIKDSNIYISDSVSENSKGQNIKDSSNYLSNILKTNNINQIKISDSVSKNIKLPKLSNDYDINAPILFFGMYNISEFNKFKIHKGKKYVIWCNNDCDYSNKKRRMLVNKIKNNITHSYYYYDNCKKNLDLFEISCDKIKL